MSAINFNCRCDVYNFNLFDFTNIISADKWSAICLQNADEFILQTSTKILIYKPEMY